MTAELRTALNQASEEFTQGMGIVVFQSLADDVIKNSILNLSQLINGHAIAIWLPEKKDSEEVLTIAYNVGARGHEIEGVVSQPLDEGLVSKAFKDNDFVCHQGFFKHREQSADVDKELGQVTAHQIAAPFQLFGKTVGAITIIQTLASGIEQQSEWGFDENDVEMFKSGVQNIERLFELNIIRKIA